MLSDKIQIMRQKAFLSQSAFAEELGVAESTINRWETGRSIPNLGALKKIKTFCEKNDFRYKDIEEAWFAEKRSAK